ncbi:MAG: hypothetical protein JSV09_04145 [Thermoplasmata archaeon]|nr:MAG: hypothetical protein JSV09_04145 [Thermoplasmata archaeon]
MIFIYKKVQKEEEHVTRENGYPNSQIITDEGREEGEQVVGKIGKQLSMKSYESQMKGGRRGDRRWEKKRKYIPI